MTWEDVLKMGNDPIFFESHVYQEMVNIKGMHPNIFRKDIDVNNLKNSLQIMNRELDNYMIHGKENDLELLNLKESLKPLEEKLSKIERLT